MVTKKDLKIWSEWVLSESEKLDEEELEMLKKTGVSEFPVKYAHLRAYVALFGDYPEYMIMKANKEMKAKEKMGEY